MNYISLGHDCHMANSLNFIKLRKESLPFDFLFTAPQHGLEYVSFLIQNNFADFTDNLDYVGNKVISKNYPYAKFYHHDLIKNVQTLSKNMTIDHLNIDNETLIDKFKRRAHRFMEKINDPNGKCLFFYVFDKKYMLSDELFNKIMSSIDLFLYTMKNYSKCQFKLIIFIRNCTDDFQTIMNKINIDNKLVIFEQFNGINKNKCNKANLKRVIAKHSF